MNRLLKQLSLTSSIAFLTACGGGGGGGSGDASSVSDYDGVWRPPIACEDDSYVLGNETFLESSEGTITINGSTAILDVTEYSASSDCTGINDKYSSNITLDYGDDAPTASSVCSNAREIDVTINSFTVNGIEISGSELTNAIANDQVPSLDSFGLICTSDDGARLYGGDDENGTKLGDSEATRPTQIDDTFYFVSQ